MTKPPKDEQYDEAEAQRRFEQAVKGGLKTPPIPLKEKPTKGKRK
ncbi:MAG: hypothetical protein ABW199_00755 [Caulobacterales bacterium]